MNGAAGRNPSEPIQLSVTSEAGCLTRVRAVVEEVARQMGFGDRDTSCLALAVSEAVSNVIKHGYEGRTGEPIDLAIEPISREGRAGLQFTIADIGRQVDPSEIRCRDLDDIRPGGLGTHIIRTIMDEVDYTQRESAGMQVRMVKMIPDPYGADEDEACPSQEDSSHGDT